MFRKILAIHPKNRDDMRKGKKKHEVGDERKRLRAVPPPIC